MIVQEVQRSLAGNQSISSETKLGAFETATQNVSDQISPCQAHLKIIAMDSVGLDPPSHLVS